MGGFEKCDAASELNSVDIAQQSRSLGLELSDEVLVSVQIVWDGLQVHCKKLCEIIEEQNGSHD